jgi:gluconolactonase
VKPVIFLAALFLGSFAFAQNFTSIQVETVARDLHYAEGPAWSLDGYLLFSDTTTDQLKKWTPGKGIADLASRAGGAAGNAYDDQGRLYTCEFRERRVTRTSKSGKVDVIAAKFEGKRLNAPNDIVVRRDGNIYFTDPAFGNQQDSRELDFYGVFRVKPGGDLEAIARWKTRPNGIALSPNGRLLYVSDSDARVVRTFDLAGNGAASNEKIFLPKIEGVPGGIRTDVKGNVYVAAKYLFAYSPAGELLKDIQFAQTPSNLAWGDPDLSGLFITAHSMIYRIRLGVKGAVPYAPQVP